MYSLLRYLCIFFTLYIYAFANGQTLSPLDFGILDAKNGCERYASLLQCHHTASRIGAKVSYKGIDSLYLEIPKNAKSIPLSENTDFCNVVLMVKNNSQDIYLFTMIKTLEPIQLTAKEVDSGHFKEKSLANGTFIITIADQKPWVLQRIGYTSPHIRRDILLVSNGKAMNKVVMPYNNPQSSIECYYTDVTKKEKKIRNLRFVRDICSTFKTCLLKAKGENNLKVENVSVYTPENSELFADHIFMIEDCTNFTLEDVTIEGTYSQLKKYGYAFGLNNVWNHKAIRVHAKGNWGVYGNNNINTAYLKDCIINRFDIHCYGRDIVSRHCKYSAYTDFSSVYGKVAFDKCEFLRARPVLIDESYNAYTGFDILFNKCIFYFNKKHYYFVDLVRLDKTPNERPELNKKCLPNIRIRNSVVFLEDGQSVLYIYKTGNVSYENTLDYVNTVDIKGLHINASEQEPELQLFTNKIVTTNPVKVKGKRIVVQNKNKIKTEYSFPQ